MRYPAREIKTKDGQTVILRNAEESDAAALLEYLRATASETRFLLSEPEEILFTLEQEKDFIRGGNESKNELMLIATLDDKHVGNCAMRSVGTKQRYRHRCSVSIALHREYWGRGIAKQMLSALLEQAKSAGYEQAELEVVASNDRAIRLYESLGFLAFGRLPNNMKYQDGSYEDAVFMVKQL